MRPAAELEVGDRVRLASGRELTITKIKPRLLGNDDLICLVEETDEGWFAQGTFRTTELELLGG
jgi:hypothetical protein